MAGTAKEIAAAADVFLAPGNGGMACWVWMKDGQPRATCRVHHALSKDPVDRLTEFVTMLASLKVAHEGLTVSTLCEQFNMSKADAMKAVELGAEVLRTKFFTVAVEPGKPDTTTVTGPEGNG